MVSDKAATLDQVFRALAHPSRRKMLRALASGERNLSELAAPFRMTFPAASKHVRVLERAKLVRRRVVGRDHICRINASPLREATEWTEGFRRLWEARFDALDSYLTELQRKEKKHER
jgi:DNA-binding transcriptional ArsR family regulator